MESPKQWTVNDALNELNVVRQRVMTMGANDNEHSVLERIATDIKSGKITPEEGVNQAYSIERGKLDYH